METIQIVTVITALLVTAGTVFSAIYAARGRTEKTLQEHIEAQNKRIDDLFTKIRELETKNAELKQLYEREKKRADDLEERVRLLSKKRKPGRTS